MVFFPTARQTQIYAEAFNAAGLNCLEIHSRKSQVSISRPGSSSSSRQTAAATAAAAAAAGGSRPRAAAAAAAAAGQQ